MFLFAFDTYFKHLPSHDSLRDLGPLGFKASDESALDNSELSLYSSALQRFFLESGLVQLVSRRFALVVAHRDLPAVGKGINQKITKQKNKTNICFFQNHYCIEINCGVTTATQKSILLILLWDIPTYSRHFETYGNMSIPGALIVLILIALVHHHRCRCHRHRHRHHRLITHYEGSPVFAPCFWCRWGSLHLTIFASCREILFIIIVDFTGSTFGDRMRDALRKSTVWVQHAA